MRARPSPPEPVGEPLQAEPARLTRPLQGVEVHKAHGLVDRELGVVFEPLHDRLGVVPAELGEEIALRGGVGWAGVREPLEGLEVEVPTEVCQERPALEPGAGGRRRVFQQLRPQYGLQRTTAGGGQRRRRR